ncbi:MAG: NUDIX domain-containing protein [bacterium]
MKHKFTFGVFAIITNEQNQILLCLRNDSDLWNLPGGGLESGETPWQGVTREVKEETGFDVEVEKLLCVYSKPDKDALGFDFKCKIIGEEITLSDESKEIKYFSKNEIPKNTLEKQIERIKDYFENENSETRMKVQLSK